MLAIESTSSCLLHLRRRDLGSRAIAEALEVVREVFDFQTH